MNVKLPTGTLEKFWKDPGNWRLNAFYYCKSDPRIIVPKRSRLLGWTMNFAHFKAWFALAAGIAGTIGPIIYFKNSNHEIWIFAWLIVIAIVSFAIGQLTSSPKRYEKEPISIRGPVETKGGKLTLMIPLEAGGSDLVSCTKGIAEIEGDYLKITIPDWLAAKMKIQEGSLIDVDNKNGKFSFSPVGNMS